MIMKVLDFLGQLEGIKEVLYFLRVLDGINKEINEYDYYHCFFIPEDRRIIVKEIINKVESYNQYINPAAIQEAVSLYMAKDPYEFDRKINLNINFPNFLDVRKFKIDNEPLETIIEKVREVFYKDEKYSNIDSLLKGINYSKITLS